MADLPVNIIKELYKNAKKTFHSIPDSHLEQAVNLITESRKVFVLGIGHSGMFGKILSMKLNHAGIKTFTVFDEINPPFSREDLFCAISQSGETPTIISLASKAKKIGGKVLAITSEEDSTLATISDRVLKIEKYAQGCSFDSLSGIGDIKNQNLLGLIFGFNLYILIYALVLMIAKKRGETPQSINARHANLQ